MLTSFSRVTVPIRLHAQEVDPLTVGRIGDLRRVAAVAGEQRVVARAVEVHAPPVALRGDSALAAGRHVHAGDPEILAARRLQIEPHRLAVPAPPLVAVDLHVHRALVHQPHLAAVGADGPRAIQLVPVPSWQYSSRFGSTGLNCR
jgi:hypothetical protein